MKNAFFTRGRLLPLVAGGLVSVVSLFAVPAAYSAAPRSSQTISPFGVHHTKVDPSCRVILISS